jgi:hypothetical protein
MIIRKNNTKIGRRKKKRKREYNNRDIQIILFESIIPTNSTSFGCGMKTFCWF